MGRKMNVTIKDVAKAAGVSIGTVDRALNNRARISEETKERVMKAVKELNYQRNEFASAIRKGVRMKILVINARNPYNYMNIFTKAFQEQAAEYAGYGMELEFVFSNTLGADDVRQVAEGVKVEEYDGILINASGQELNDFINRTRKAGIPIATFNSDSFTKTFSSLLPRNRLSQARTDVPEVLQSQGRNLPPSDLPFCWWTRRWAGIQS